MIWELINEYPAAVLAGEGDAYFAEAVTRQTEGRVVVHALPDAKSGVRTRDQIKAVSEGRFAMASSFAGALADESPAFLLSSLPFITPSADSARALTAAAMPLYERLFAKRRQKVLYISPWPPTGLWSARAVSDAAALRALKVRTYDKASAEVFARAATLGCVISFSDLPPKLQSGEIDAVVSSGDGDAGRRLQAWLKHYTAIAYAIPVSFGMVSLAAWDKLDTRDRTLVEAAGRDTTERQWTALTGRVARNYAAFRADGVAVNEQPAASVMAALRAAATQTIADWRAVAGAEACQILDAHIAR